MNEKINSTEKEQLQRNLTTLSQMLSDDTGFELKSLIIDLDCFDLSIEQLQKETSINLIARLVQSITDGDKTLFPSHHQRELMVWFIDPDIVALVRESQLCRVFSITETELRANRDSGVLMCVDRNTRYMYDWNQVRKLFNKPPESTSNPKR